MRTAPTFADAVRMHDLIDSAQRSYASREFVPFDTQA
jgi:hypothetical protein